MSNLTYNSFRRNLLFNFLVALVFILNVNQYLFSQGLPAEKFTQYNLLADQIIKSALRERKGYEWLKELCEKGPRLSGSENSLRAIEWAKEKMEKLNLDSVWLQPVMVPHWERGKNETAVITSGSFSRKHLNILALGGSVPTPTTGITAQVIEIKNFSELSEKKEQVKNKIVFFSRPIDQGSVNTFSGYGNAVDQRSVGAIYAARYGATGVLIRSVTTKFDNAPHTGLTNYADTIPKIPAAALGYLDADFLSEALKKDPNLKLKMILNCKTLPDAKSFNVIGEIKGSTYPDEVIVVGGHFDSWDVGCGAHDDGAGCIQALEVLDIFKRLNFKPKRTIRCIFFINEENGSRGGIKYGEWADSSEDIHVAAIESDRGAFTPRGFYVDSDSLTLAKIHSWLPILQPAYIEWIRKGGSGVDISYIKNTKSKLGFVPDDQRYMDIHHSANDVFEEVHPREMELGTAAIAIMTLLLSEEGL